jgi:hypothetical protein
MMWSQPEIITVLVEFGVVGIAALAWLVKAVR